MTGGSLSGRRLVLDNRLEVGVSCKMDGRGSRSILCILLVVSNSYLEDSVVSADSASELYRMGAV